MSISRLKTLVAIAEQGSFSAATGVIHLSQSAISLQMKSVEDEFGVSLFDRSKRPPTLNKLGWAVIPKAREIIKAYDTLVESVADENALSGELHIGAMPSTMVSLTPKAVNALRSIYPNLYLKLSPEESPALLSLVDQGQLDVAVISEPPQIARHMEFRQFAEEPLVLLAPLNCKIDSPREILSSYPFIRFTRSLWAGQWIDNWLRQEKIHVNEVIELGSHEMISALVFQSLGVAITTSPCIPSPNPLPLRRIPLEPAAPPRKLGVLVRRDNPNLRLSDVFFEQIVKLINIENDRKKSDIG